MTDQEINLAIAKAKGWKLIENPEVHEVTLDHYSEAPDYINDPALILELEDELLSDSWELGKGPTNYYWASTEYSKCGKGTAIRDTKHGKATALAWLTMRGVEV